MFSIFQLFTRGLSTETPMTRPWPEQERAALLQNVCTALRLGYLDDARVMLHDDPHASRDAACLNLLGVIYEMRQQWSLARKHYRKAVRADGEYMPARQNIRRFYELDSFGHSDQSVALGDERPALGMLLMARRMHGNGVDRSTPETPAVRKDTIRTA